MDDTSIEIFDMLEEGSEPDPEPVAEVDAQPVEEPDPEPVAEVDAQPVEEPVVLGAPLLRAGTVGIGGAGWRDGSSYDSSGYMGGDAATSNQDQIINRRIVLATDEILGAIDGAKSDVLAAVPAGTSGTTKALDSSDVQVLEGGTYTITIDPEQWDELRDCWHYAKEYGSIATVSIVLQLGILAALLGARMYGIFAEGWRSHA